MSPWSGASAVAEVFTPAAYIMSQMGANEDAARMGATASASSATDQSVDYKNSFNGRDYNVVVHGSANAQARVRPMESSVWMRVIRPPIRGRGRPIGCNSRWWPRPIWSGDRLSLQAPTGGSTRRWSD